MPSPSCLMSRLGWSHSCVGGAWRMGGRSRQPTGMARGLGQDVGKARVSPVSTRGFPDPCQSIVCLRMSHLWSPWFPPFQLPLPASPSPPCQPSPPCPSCGAAVSMCPAFPPPTPSGLRHGQQHHSGAERLASVCLGSLLGLKTPTREEMAFGPGGQARLGRRLERHWFPYCHPQRSLGECLWLPGHRAPEV